MRGIVRTALLIGMLALPACGEGNEPEVSVQEALSREGEVVRVEGYGLVRSRVVYLCDALTTAKPPKCLGPSIRVRGLSPSDIERRDEVDGVTWTDTKLTVLGKVEDGLLSRVARA